MAASTLRPLILICDDEMPLRELIKAALGDRYRYVEAGDADEAEARLSAENPEAIVLDVMLPGRSGIEFLTELRAGSESPAIPVVVCLAWQSADDAKAAFGAGANAFVGKPFDPEDLPALLKGSLLHSVAGRVTAFTALGAAAIGATLGLFFAANGEAEVGERGQHARRGNQRRVLRPSRRTWSSSTTRSRR